MCGKLPRDQSDVFKLVVENPFIQFTLIYEDMTSTQMYLHCGKRLCLHLGEMLFTPGWK